MIIETVVVGPLQVNCYILGTDKNRAMIVDPGDESKKIKRLLEKLKLSPKFIIITHSHYDHIGAVGDFNLPVYIHKLDKDALLDPMKNMSSFLGSSVSIKAEIHALDDKDIIELDEIKLNVLHTPGHTQGGICLYNEGSFVLTGDTLFCQGIGRTDFPGASYELLMQSINEKLFTLKDNIIVYPGHGPQTSIGREK